MKNEIKCQKCNGKSMLHVGDKFAFGGNKTHHSHGYLGQMGENRGLWLSGPSKQVKFVLLNPNKATKKHYKEANEMGNFVLDPNDFEKALSKVCREF